MCVFEVRRMLRLGAVAAVLAGSLGVSAGPASGGAPPFAGPLVAASGQAGDILVCSLLFVPAIQRAFGDDRAEGHLPPPGPIDRYDKLEILYVAFESGDLRHPYIVGSLWNGEDRPPTSRLTVPFVPSTPDARQVLALSFDHLAELSGPDFNLVCDVLADGGATPRRLPHTLPVTKRRGVVSDDRVFFNYAYFQNAVADARVDVRLLYLADPPGDSRTARRGRCPTVDIEVRVVDATTMESLEGTAFSAAIAPGEAFGHTIGIAHEHQPPGDSPAAPVLVVLRHTARTAIGPHCAVFPSVEVTGNGITRNMDIWEWRREIETGATDE